MLPVVSALRADASVPRGAPPPTAAYDWPIWNDEASRDERFVGYLNALLLLCQPTHPDEVE